MGWEQGGGEILLQVLKHAIMHANVCPAEDALKSSRPAGRKKLDVT